MVLMVLIDVRVIWILRDERDEVVLHESILAQQATHFFCLSHPPALHNNGKKQKQQQQSVAAAGNSLDQQSQRCSHVLGVLPPTAPCWLAVVVQLLHPGTQAGKAHTQRHMSAKQPTHTHMHAHTHTHTKPHHCMILFNSNSSLTASVASNCCRSRTSAAVSPSCEPYIEQ